MKSKSSIKLLLLFLLFVKILIEIDTNIVLIIEFGEKSLKLLDYSHQIV